MRLSNLFSKTQREIPADAETVSHQLLIRAGMIQQLTAGVYSYLPLAWRALRKIENIIRDEMNKAGGQEINMPVLQPIELWQKTGRDLSFGQSLFCLKDRRNRPLILGPTHEEVVTELASRYIRSYRDLPQLLYQIQIKFRDEPRPRGGLIRVREFTMKDLYSFDTDEINLEKSYQKMLKAYQNVYHRCGLTTMMIEADSGAIGGKASHEFMVITDTGEDEVIYCEKCGYAANVEKAVSAPQYTSRRSKLLVLEEVATPGKQSIEELTDFLKIQPKQTLKAVFYIADNDFVFVVIRGDMEVNEVKLKNTLKATELRLATEDEVSNAGIIAGSASPIGLEGLRVIVDQSVNYDTNYIAGANKEGYHLKNVNYPRDFVADTVSDIALARAGSLCTHCNSQLKETRGIEVGHIFKLGTFPAEALDVTFTDMQGEGHPIVMGCYGIGLGRLLAAAIEQNHDDKGIMWPLPIAPFQIYLCPLYYDKHEIKEVTDDLYEKLENSGFEVLLDDRDDSPGIKFNDADLLGLPIRLTLSPRTLKTNSIELKWRWEKRSQNILLNDLIKKLHELL
jgi:prolyl-tRNA synthetase